MGDVGTDRLRAATFGAPLAAAVGRTAYRDRIAVAAGQGYAAPPLTGLWASAPYLHNGSVATLDALLTPARRITRFQVGGHALDFARIGLKLAADGSYPTGYRPFATPVWIDTRSTGRGKDGHDFGADLSPRDKAALLAFLKLL